MGVIDNFNVKKRSRFIEILYFLRKQEIVLPLYDHLCCMFSIKYIMIDYNFTNGIQFMGAANNVIIFDVWLHP